MTIIIRRGSHCAAVVARQQQAKGAIERKGCGERRERETARVTGKRKETGSRSRRGRQASLEIRRNFSRENMANPSSGLIITLCVLTCFIGRRHTCDHRLEAPTKGN